MNGTALLLWAHVLLIWAVANYVARDPIADDDERKSTRWRVWVAVRAFAAVGITAFIAPSNLRLAVLMFAFTIALPLLRVLFPASRCAELEIATNTVFVVVSFVTIRNAGAALERVMFTMPFADKRIAAASIVVALTLFTVHGGTNIVRGVLKKSGAIPTLQGSEEKTLDVKEFNRGRLIGALERVLLFAVVIAGSYEAIGFIVAAKGLIRSREFEVNRDMTEYFLIGSLASVLIALVTGSIAKGVLGAYW